MSIFDSIDLKAIGRVLLFIDEHFLVLTCTIIEFGATLDGSGDDVDATRHLPLERSLNSQGGKSFQSSLSVIDGEHSTVEAI